MKRLMVCIILLLFSIATLYNQYYEISDEELKAYEAELIRLEKIAIIYKVLGNNVCDELIAGLLRDDTDFPLIISIIKQESNGRNATNITTFERSFGYVQMQDYIIQALYELYPNRLPHISDGHAFLDDPYAQVLYCQAYFDYIDYKYPNITLTTKIRMYNGGEVRYRMSPPRYYESVLSTLNYISHRI